MMYGEPLTFGPGAGRDQGLESRPEMLELVLTLIVPSGVGSRCHLMSIADVRRRLVLSGAVRWVQSLSDPC